jgi:hypothetical protein
MNKTGLYAIKNFRTLATIDKSQVFITFYEIVQKLLQFNCNII